MDHIKILKRAFDITLHYRALWFFGILLALTSARGGGDNGGGGGQGGNSFLWPPALSHFPTLPPTLGAFVGQWFLIIGLLVCFGLVIGIGIIVLRYLSETALIRMVDHYETSGKKVGIRQGFHLGWSRSAFRMFMIDLLLGLGLLVVFLVLFGLAFSPLLLTLFDVDVLNVLGGIATAGMVSLVVGVLLIVLLILALLLQFFHRACVLENLGVIESIRRGWALMRQRLGEVVIMGLLVVCVWIVWLLVSIPVIIAIGLLAMLLAGLPAGVVALITQLVAGGSLPWILGGVAWMLIFILLLALPLLFLSGLLMVYTSSTWTLTYRELHNLEKSHSSQQHELPAVSDALPA